MKTTELPAAAVTGLIGLAVTIFDKIFGGDPKKRALKRYVKELEDAEIITKERRLEVMYRFEMGQPYEHLLPHEEDENEAE